MTGAGQNDLENTSWWQLLAIGAICYGRGDGPRQAIFRSAQATLQALRTSGFRAVTVAVTVQQCSEEARLRGPGLRPAELPEARLRGPGLRPAELPADELVAEQGGGRDRRRRRGSSRSSLGAGVPCGGRDAAATPLAGQVTRCRSGIGGGDGNRTRVQGFAGPCLNHSATPPRKLPSLRPMRPQPAGSPWIPRTAGCPLRCSASPSGRRDSNPRPSPWQGDALPTEPRPHASHPTGRRRERARRANRTVADPGRRANSGSVKGRSA